jgi:hypothetical protein
MEKLMITISTENAAFQDSNLPFELARIFKKMANDLENSGTLCRSYNDINGNKVATVQEI